VGVIRSYVALSEIFGNGSGVQPAAGTFCAFQNYPTTCNTVGAVLQVLMPHSPCAAAYGTFHDRRGSRSHQIILSRECTCVNSPVVMRYNEEQTNALG
jgi:hypothetical protein